MNKQELVKKVAAAAEMTQKDAALALEAALNAIVEAVASGDKVQLVGFGTFESRRRDARIGYNPQNGEPVEIAAGAVPSFKAGKAFRDAVNR